MKFLRLLAMVSVLFLAVLPLAAEEPRIQTRLEPGATTDEFRAVLELEIPPGLHLYAPGEENGIPVSLQLSAAASGVEIGPVAWPPHTEKEYESLGGKLKLYEGSLQIAVPVKRIADVPGFSLNFAWQACTDIQCFMPAEKRLDFVFPPADSVSSSPAQGSQTGETRPARTADRRPVQEVAEPKSVSSPDEGVFARAYADHGLIYALLLAFLFGLVSSLTPCVYPMIPITVAFFGSDEGGEAGGRGRRFLHSLVFALGIGLSFALLGGFFTWLGRDLGSIFANAWAAGIIAGILLLFALASFEFFELKPPAFLMDRVSGPSRRGFVGVLVMGLTLGLVAAPCVGPFAGSLLLFVAALGSVIQGFLLLFVYGLGLGSLFMAVALGVSFLPRAGGWMVQLKMFFGSVILLSTVYVLQFVLPDWGLALYAGFLLLFTAALLDPLKTPDTQGFLVVFLRTWALACLVAGVVLFAWGVARFLPVVPPPGVLPVQNTAAAAWLHDHDQALARGRAEGKPVFLDFYADWCLPCKKMEKIFADPDVAAELDRFVRAKLDCTRPELPAARIKQDLYGVPYMPYLALYDRQGNFLREKSFPGYTDRDSFLARLREIQ